MFTTQPHSTAPVRSLEPTGDPMLLGLKLLHSWLPLTEVLRTEGHPLQFRHWSGLQSEPQVSGKSAAFGGTWLSCSSLLALDAAPGLRRGGKFPAVRWGRISWRIPTCQHRSTAAPSCSDMTRTPRVAMRLSRLHRVDRWIPQLSGHMAPWPQHHKSGSAQPLGHRWISKPVVVPSLRPGNRTEKQQSGEAKRKTTPCKTEPAWRIGNRTTLQVPYQFTRLSVKVLDQPTWKQLLVTSFNNNPPTPADSRGSASEKSWSKDKKQERRRHGSSRRKKQKQERRGPQAGSPSGSNVRHWGPWPAGPVRPSGPCCFGVAKVPFVSLRGWKTDSSES